MDSETIKVSKNNRPSDLNPIMSGVIGKIPLKLMFYLFIVYMFISSDVFIKRILSKVDNAVNVYSSTTTKGTVITGIILVIFIAIIDQLIEFNIV